VHIPLTGIVFVPLTTLVFLLWPSRLEELLLYLVVFQGAAVLNLGGGFGFGLSPYFFAASLLAARVGIKWSGGQIRFHRDEFAQRHLRVAALFISWCVVSAFLLPILFRGMPVDSPRAGAENQFYLRLPLQWTFSNAGQAGYMVLNFFVLVALTDFCTRRPPQLLIKAFSYSGLIVVLVGLYQMLCNSLGLPFPTAFFNSNGTWAQNYAQMIGAGWHRVSSTFVEPSEAGGFLSSWLLFELVFANEGSDERVRHTVFAILGCVILLATTSTTGYVTVGLVAAFMLGRFLLQILEQGRISTRLGLALATIFLVVGVFLACGHGSLLNDVLWNKVGSESGVVRTATMWRGFDVMLATYGLGAGLGSNRAFGMLAYIAANLGICGLAVFLYLLGQILYETFNSLKASPLRGTSRTLLIACVGAFCATQIGLVMSGAEISEPRMWVLWGMLLASVRATAAGNFGAGVRIRSYTFR
jgi:hypothetical protein